MSAFKTDGDFSTAVATGKPRISYPIAGDTTAQIISQDFMVAFASYAAPTLSSVHPTIATAYCIGDGDLQDHGGGICSYTRQWATIPAARNEWGTFAYRFPGLYGNANPPYSQYWVADTGGGRDPQTLPAHSRIAYEYFLCAAGQTYTSPGDIPVIEAQVWGIASNPNARVDYLLPAGVYWSDSTPTKEDYQDMITNGDEIVAEDSILERWQGEIYVRITRYVTAQ